MENRVTLMESGRSIPKAPSGFAHTLDKRFRSQ
jgi:hypothetical protein